ncbi:phosphoglycerate kinase [Patescibacteria group bacterium]|nr:phosphoglycerate kinase [Patescibacteria group bacterium]
MTYLLRIGLDIAEKNPSRHARFIDAVQSIKHVSRPINKIVLLAHRGRPDGKIVSKLSLRRFVPYLNKALGKKVIFLPSTNLLKSSGIIKTSPKGSIFLLENVRFFKGEIDNSQKFVGGLASLGDSYIIDDFSDAHRRHASTYGLAKELPGKMGLHLKEELSHLSKAINFPKRPNILILGGAKANEKIAIASKMLKKVDYILLGGVSANNFLKARGVNIGKSIYDKQAMLLASKLANREKIVTPVDWILSKDAIVDIGPMTINEYKKIIADAKTIIWNGPMGRSENLKFRNGTVQIKKAVFVNKKADVIIGGGDTLASMEIKSPPKNVFISTGGGAMLTFLAGKKLPVVEVMK